MHNAHILSVVFADDEMPIREELRMFDWESCQAVLVGGAANGAEALDLCGEYEPDLLLADITMPVMDGLTLMRRVRTQFPRMQVALLTCHEDFGYVRQALQSGAIDYILKMTMTDDDIRRVIEKARSHLQQQQYAEDRRKEAQRLAVSDWMQELLTHPDSPETENRFPLPYPFHIIRVCLTVQYKDWIFVDREIRNALESQTMEWAPTDGGEYVFFVPAANAARLPEYACRILQKLRGTIAERLSYLRGPVDMCAIVSGPIAGRAVFAAEWQRQDGWKTIRFYETETDVFTGEPAAQTKLSAGMRAEWMTRLHREAVDSDAVRRFFRETVWPQARRLHLEPDELRNTALQLMGEAARLLSPDSPKNLPSHQLLECSSLNALAEMTDVFFRKPADIACSAPIREAKKWIQDNLAVPLTLASVSARVGLSPSYFSRVFAEQTRDSFNEYVTKRRMERAIRLLRETDCKVYEVADQVGITSYRYFSSLFKNWTGLTPREFRKRC